MFSSVVASPKQSAARVRNSARGFVKDSNGAAAIEMAMVTLPFMIIMFGIINTGMYFYAVNCLDRGLDDTARYLRTGEAQKGGVSNLTTVGQFRDMVCSKATSYIDCSNLQIHVQSGTDWSNIQAVSCITNGNLAGGISSADSTSISNFGTQNGVLLIVACYKFNFLKFLPFVKIDKQFADGSSLIQSSTALKIEPYN